MLKRVAAAIQAFRRPSVVEGNLALKATESEIVDGTRGWEIFEPFLSGAGAGAKGDKALMQLYSKLSLVWICVRELQTSTPEARLRFIRRDPAGEVVEVTAHPMLELLHRPNRDMSGYDLLEYIVMHLHLAGKSFLWKWRSGRGRPAEVWPVPPNLVKVVTGTLHPDGGGQLIQGYKVLIDKEWMPVEARDMVYMRFPDPLSLTSGLSPLLAGARETDAEDERADYTKHILINYGVAGGVASTDQPLTAKQVDSIRRQMTSRISGDKRGSLLLLHSGLKLDQGAMTPKEIDLPGVASMSESRICALFGVPPEVVGVRVGLEHSTYSNKAEARKRMWEDTISPLLRRLAGGLTDGFLRAEGDQRTEVDFDTSDVRALREDADKRHERWRADWDSGLAMLNEARAGLSLVPVRDGEVFKLHLQDVLQPATPEASPAKARRAVLLPFNAKERVAGLRIAESRPTLGAVWEPKIARVFRAELIKRGADAIAAIEEQGTGGSLEDAWRALATKWSERTREVFRPLAYEMVSEGYELGLRELGLRKQAEPTLDIDWDFQRDALVADLDEYVVEVCDATAATTTADLTGLLQQGVQEGWGAAGLADKIAAYTEEGYEWRALRIARTESIRAYNYGARRSYIDAGVQYVKWLSVGDSCAVCSAEAAKGAVPIEDFTPPPKHRNCTCSHAAVVE